MLVAILIPVLLLIATVLMERFESRVLDVPSRRRPLRSSPLRLEAAPVAERHLRAVPEPLVVDVAPAEVTDRPLPLPRAS